MAAVLGVLLITSQDCCTDLPPEEGVIGVTIQHPDGGDTTQHEIDLYWAPPPGRRLIVLLSFDPLTIDGPVVCPCGWSGTVVDGIVVPTS